MTSVRMKRAKDKLYAWGEAFLKRPTVCAVIRYYQVMYNKLKIKMYALQVIYLYSKIVSTRDTAYSSPAKEFVASFLKVFGLEFLNYAPPECVNPLA